LATPGIWQSAGFAENLLFTNAQPYNWKYRGSGTDSKNARGGGFGGPSFSAYFFANEATLMKRGNSGFTLLEVLVSLVIVLLVLGLVAEAVTLVSETVSAGQRRIDLQRQLDTARRVLVQDVAAIADSERWPVYYGGTDQTEQPVFAFLRYQNGAEGETETEWVQYWLRPHPTEEGRLFVLVRYASSADDRAGTAPQDRELGPTDQEEVVLDHVIDIDIRFWAEGGEISAGSVSIRPSAIDLRLAVTRPPFPVELTHFNFLDRVRKEKGEWIGFRCRPEVSQ